MRNAQSYETANGDDAIGGIPIEKWLHRQVRIDHRKLGSAASSPTPHTMVRLIDCNERGKARVLPPGHKKYETVPVKALRPNWSENPDLKREYERLRWHKRKKKSQKNRNKFKEAKNGTANANKPKAVNGHDAPSRAPKPEKDTPVIEAPEAPAQLEQVSGTEKPGNDVAQEPKTAAPEPWPYTENMHKFFIVDWKRQEIFTGHGWMHIRNINDPQDFDLLCSAGGRPGLGSANRTLGAMFKSYKPSVHGKGRNKDDMHVFKKIALFTRILPRWKQGESFDANTVPAQVDKPKAAKSVDADAADSLAQLWMDYAAMGRDLKAAEESRQKAEEEVRRAKAAEEDIKAKQTSLMVEINKAQAELSA